MRRTLCTTTLFDKTCRSIKGHHWYLSPHSGNRYCDSPIPGRTGRHEVSPARSLKSYSYQDHSTLSHILCCTNVTTYYFFNTSLAIDLLTCRIVYLHEQSLCRPR